MRKSIKNYTTSIKVMKSLNEIQEMLAAYGAQKVMIDYENGEPTAITFAMNTPKGLVPVRLPANIEKIGVRMYKNRWQYLRDSQKNQAKMTGWRNIKDWIDAQLALVETEMVKIEQIFLPYVVMGSQTVYEHFESGNLLASGN